jgi:hypothetical protein
MTEDGLQRSKGLLEELKAELTASLEKPNFEAAPVSPDSAIGRLTRQDAMQSQQMALEIERPARGFSKLSEPCGESTREPTACARDAKRRSPSRG